jgi:hypothetical protein
MKLLLILSKDENKSLENDINDLSCTLLGNLNSPSYKQRRKELRTDILNNRAKDLPLEIMIGE